MTALALIEALATLLWVYTALTFAAWLLQTFRQGAGTYVAAVVELVSHLVPAMVGLVVLVLIGAFIGLPSVVAFIAVLFPAGTAYGIHTALSEAREVPHSALRRVCATLILGASIIAYRQLL